MAGTPYNCWNSGTSELVLPGSTVQFGVVVYRLLGLVVLVPLLY
jgi:hypothetical protein